MRSRKIKSIKSIGYVDSMDIEVKSDKHIFYGNGIATSNSHGVSYAVNAYNSAHEKVYHTTKFFTSYLTFASEKQDPHEEVSELVSEAKLFDIEFVLPKLSFFSLDFKQIGDRKILFGIKSIKSLTGITGDKLFEVLQNIKVKPLDQLSWMDVLIYISNEVNSTAFKALCSAGFFCYNNNGLTRNRAIYEYKIFSSLTKSEMEWVKKEYPQRQWKDLESCLTDLAPVKKLGGGTSKLERSQAIINEIHFMKNPPYSLEDTPAWIVAQEKKLFGCPLSISSIESSDTSSANTTCKEISNGKTGKFLCVAATIKRMNTCKVKNGKSKGELMSFLTIEDESCVLDNVVVFPMTRKQYEYCLYEGNNLLICGSVNKSQAGFLIEKVYEI